MSVAEVLQIVSGAMLDSKSQYRVELEVFRGPLDLLLFLVRRHEVEITEIPVAIIAEQFLEYVDVLQAIDVNAAGDFLVMASTLMEIKSLQLLPHAGEEEEVVEDPRQNLVEQLIEYKKYRDAASMLDERARAWQERFPRLQRDVLRRERDPAEEPIREVELWDLVSAFGRIMRDNAVVKPSSIVYDETPIHVYMERIRGRLLSEQRVAFDSLFERGMHKSVMIGIFLAILELVRHCGASVEQDENFGEFFVSASPDLAQRSFAESAISSYEHGPAGETASSEGGNAEVGADTNKPADADGATASADSSGV